MAGKMSTFIKVNERTPITSISSAITATESGRRSANLTRAIIRGAPQQRGVKNRRTTGCLEATTRQNLPQRFNRSSRRLNLQSRAKAGWLRIFGNAGQAFHFGDDAGEVFVGAVRCAGGVDLKRGGRHGHRCTQFVRPLEDQFEVL